MMFEEEFAESIKLIFLKNAGNEKPVRECVGLIDDLSFCPLIRNKAVLKKKKGKLLFSLLHLCSSLSFEEVLDLEPFIMEDVSKDLYSN